MKNTIVPAYSSLAHIPGKLLNRNSLSFTDVETVFELSQKHVKYSNRVGFISEDVSRSYNKWNNYLVYIYLESGKYNKMMHMLRYSEVLSKIERASSALTGDALSYKRALRESSSEDCQCYDGRACLLFGAKCLPNKVKIFYVKYHIKNILN